MICAASPVGEQPIGVGQLVLARHDFADAVLL
jgi:hypothetical protein